MIEAHAAQSTKPDGITWTVKIILFAMPATVVEQLFPHGHFMLFGASFILGAFLQALVPPRTYRLPLILGIAVLAAVATPIVAKFAGWN